MAEGLEVQVKIEHDGNREGPSQKYENVPGEEILAHGYLNVPDKSNSNSLKYHNVFGDDDDFHSSKLTTQADVIAHLPSKQPTLEGCRTLDRSRTFRSLRRRKSSKRSLRDGRMTVSTSASGIDDLLDGDVSFSTDAISDVDTLKGLQQIKSLTSSLDTKRRASADHAGRPDSVESGEEDQLLQKDGTGFTGYKKWKYDRALEWQRQKQRMRETFSNLHLWHSSFKKIEGYAGPSALSYFRFVKYLFLFNVASMLIILGTIILPQAFMEPSNFADSLKNEFSNATLNPFEENALKCSEFYQQNQTWVVNNQAIINHILDFFQGTGWMENTYVFMGFYFNKTYTFIDQRAHYNMPLAFLFSLVGYMIMSLVIMVNFSARGVKDKLVNSSDRLHRYCNKVFCGWDYGLSTDKGSNMKKKQLFMEYKFDLDTEKRKEARQSISTFGRMKLYLIRILINIVVIIILIGVGILIYYVIAVWMPSLLRKPQVQTNAFYRLVVEFLPSIVLTVLNAIVPILFLKLVIPESYSPENEIKVTIGRTVFLRLATVAMYAITIAVKVIDCDKEAEVCGCQPYECWETYMGQQFYKLVVTDFFVVFGLTFLLDFPRRFIVDKFPNNKVVQLIGATEFDIVINVLDIVYTQTITWIGGFFCPIIPFIAVVRFFCTFYLKKLTLFKFCVPQPRQNKASQTAHFFMIVLLVSFALCGFALAYTIGRMNPSSSCSPFRIHSRDDFYMYVSVLDAISTLPSALRQFFSIIGTFVFFLIIVIIVSLAIYYHVAVASAHKHMAGLLRQQLALEGQDKQFLLKRVNEVLQGTSASS